MAKRPAPYQYRLVSFTLVALCIEHLFVAHTLVIAQFATRVVQSVRRADCPLSHVIGGSTIPHRCVVRVACTRHAGISRNKRNGGAASQMVCRAIGAGCIIEMGALEGTLGNDSPVTNRHMFMGSGALTLHTWEPLYYDQDRTRRAGTVGGG